MFETVPAERSTAVVAPGFSNDGEPAVDTITENCRIFSVLLSDYDLQWHTRGAVKEAEVAWDTDVWRCMSKRSITVDSANPRVL